MLSALVALLVFVVASTLAALAMVGALLYLRRRAFA